MKRCKTCKYFSPDGPRDDYPGTGGSCLSPLVAVGYRALEVPEGGLLVENDEGWGASMSPTFGCVNHEEKEDGEEGKVQ